MPHEGPKVNQPRTLRGIAVAKGNPDGLRGGDNIDYPPGFEPITQPYRDDADNAAPQPGAADEPPKPYVLGGGK